MSAQHPEPLDDPALHNLLDALARPRPGVCLDLTDTHIILVEAGQVSTLPRTALDAVLGRGHDPRRHLERWVDHRQVPDPVASRKGVAVLRWRNQCHDLFWTVTVPRTSGVCMDWLPGVATLPSTTEAIRQHARRRAAALTVTVSRVGDVSLWTCRANPALSTAVLSNPYALAPGVPIEEMSAVVAPGRPVAVASTPAAQRLADEAADPCVLVSLASLATTGWM